MALIRLGLPHPAIAIWIDRPLDGGHGMAPPTTDTEELPYIASANVQRFLGARPPYALQTPSFDHRPLSRQRPADRLSHPRIAQDDPPDAACQRLRRAEHLLFHAALRDRQILLD